MQAKTRIRGSSTLAKDGFAYTREVFMLLGDEGDGKTTRGPWKFGFVPEKSLRRDFLKERRVNELSLPF